MRHFRRAATKQSRMIKGLIHQRMTVITSIQKRSKLPTIRKKNTQQTRPHTAIATAQSETREIPSRDKQQENMQWQRVHYRPIES